MSVLTSRPLYLLGGAVTALFLAAAVIVAARAAGTSVLLGAVAGVQVLLAVGWLITTDPPSPRAVVSVAAGTAAVADAVAVLADRPTLSPLAGVLGLSVLPTIVVQLARGVARARVTEAMASTLGLTAAVVSVAALLVLRRQHGGQEVVTAAAVAGGIGLMTARFVDFVLPVPHLGRGVMHGGLGLVIGSMTGTAAGAFFATVPSLTPQRSALFAGAVALVAVLADLAAAYAITSVPERPRYSFVAGPLMALVAVAPIAYLLDQLMVD
ncbi:MAG: hypothetical protein ABJA34_07220 [Pseudonocardiales bacterium]